MESDVRPHDPSVTLEVITSRRAEASAEAHADSNERRPELSAESMSPSMRVGLGGLVIFAALAMAAMAVAAAWWPDGLLHLGAIAPPAFAGFVGLSWMLFLVFGALLENNRALGPRAHRGWLAAFVVTGPLSLAVYWMLHVWPARYAPRTR